MTNCLFFGDSITYGEYDGVLGGYVEILKRFCHTEFYNNDVKEVNCFNLGIGGETTNGVLKRFRTEVEARLSSDENIIFLFYGANDLAKSDGQELVSLNQFDKNLNQLIQDAKEFTSKVYIISILPISSKVDGVSVPNRKLRTSEQIKRYNNTIENLASQNKINFINLYDNFSLNKEDYISKDGVHPNEKGYQFIANEIKPIITKYL